MNLKRLLIILLVLLPVALAACGLLPGGGSARTPAPGQPTQAGALPPGAPTQAGGPAGAATTDTGALPSIPRTPTATPPAAQCETYDDFNNKSFDGSFNADLWPKPESGQAVPLSVVQHDGFLELSNQQPTGLNRYDYTMTLKRPGARPVEQLLCFEAKLRLGAAAHKSGFVTIKLSVISDTNDVSECRLQSPQPGGPVQYRCEFVGRYITPFVAAKYDTWHKARIEIQPQIDSKSLIWNYYLDDVLVGTYNTGVSALFNSKFTPSIVMSYNSADAVAAGYVDDVKITPAK